MRRCKGIILGLLLILNLTLVGCGSKAEMTPEMPKSEACDVTETSEQQQSDEVSEAKVSNDKEKQGETINISLNSPLNRKIIKKGTLYLQTKTFEKTVNAILKEVQSLGGFVENSTIESDNANIVVRVPSAGFDVFLNHSDDFGTVKSKTMTGEDVTDQYVDTAARLKSLQVQSERLIALLNQSGSLEDLFTIEKELANVHYEIEILQGTLNKYDSLVNYATIEITVQEVKTYEEVKEVLTLTDKMARAYKKSLGILKVGGESLLLLIVSLIPFIVIIGIPVGLILLVIKKITPKDKKEKASSNKKDESNQDESE